MGRLLSRRTKHSLAKHASLSGTTIIAVPLREGVLVGYDSRAMCGYFDGRIVSETAKKVARFTSASLPSPVVVGIAGNARRCEAMCTKVQEAISSVEALQGVDEPITHMANLGCTFMEPITRPVQNFDCYIAGMQQERATVFLLKHCPDEKTNQIVPSVHEMVTKYGAIGTGAKAASHALGKQLEDITDISLSVGSNAIKFALLQAALSDQNTGGSLQVILVKSNGIDTIFNDSVIKLYSQFSNKLPDTMVKSVFIVYRLNDIDESKIITWLGRGGVIRRDGHPLTNLKGDYYIRLVTYIEGSSVDKILGQARIVPELTELQFTNSSIELKCIEVEGETNKYVYIAKVDDGFLASLICSRKHDEENADILLL